MTPDSEVIEDLMRQALAVARDGSDHGEIPIGAVIAGVSAGSYEVLGRGYNRNTELQRRIAHAEMVALNDASDRLMAQTADTSLPNDIVLLDRSDVVLVTTVEPCIMCYSAAIVSSIRTIVYGLPSPANAGPGRVSMVDTPQAQEPMVIGGVLASASRDLFGEWQVKNKGKRHSSYVEQLLALTAS